ncbi:DNA polymerase III subunit delta [Candidatus Dojkabacteria bacterium]|nr:DNA polymerase III subunit delta [Candidatus Dojkabacteria bacterium]
MLKLLHGKNSFLSLQEAQNLISKIKDRNTQKNEDFEVRIIDASEKDADYIINEIETPDLLSRNKIILLKRYTQNSESDKLQDFLIELSSRDQDNIDLIIWEDQKLRSNSKIVGAYKKIDAVFESPDLNKRTFLRWAKEYLSKNEIVIDNRATHLLSERVNYDPERLTRETSKLKLLGKGAITEEDIEKICPDTLEHDIWEMINFINNNETKEAGKSLKKIVRQGIDPIFILLMLARNMRIILLTKVLTERGLSTSEIARKIKVPPFTINQIKNISRQTSYTKIKKIYEKICNIDYFGKTGQLDVELALNILLSVI